MNEWMSSNCSHLSYAFIILNFASNCTFIYLTLLRTCAYIAVRRLVLLVTSQFFSLIVAIKCWKLFHGSASTQELSFSRTKANYFTEWLKRKLLEVNLSHQFYWCCFRLLTLYDFLNNSLCFIVRSLRQWHFRILCFIGFISRLTCYISKSAKTEF